MYAIISGGVLLSICEKPNYSKKNPKSGAFILCSKEEATGVAVDGQNYKILGTDVEPYPDAPVAEIRNIDGASQYLFEAFMKSLKAETDVNDLDNAVLDMSETTQEQIDDLTTAIFDLAEQMAATAE